MYMPNKACNHDTWKKKKEERWGRKRKDVVKLTGDSSTKLQLTELMKQSLVTEGDMSAKQAISL